MSSSRFWQDFAILQLKGTIRAQRDHVAATIGHTQGVITTEEYNRRFRQLVDQAKATR